MFSILRYPLFLSLVVDFAATFQLSWPDGADIEPFYVGNKTASVSWSRDQSDSPGNIMVYVTNQDLSNIISPYRLTPEIGLFGDLPIEIPQFAGNFSVAAYADNEEFAESRLPETSPLAPPLPFFVQLPNNTNSTNTGPASQTVEPSTTATSNNSTSTLTMPSGPPLQSTSPQSATPSPVTDLSARPNKSIIIGSVVGGVIILVLASLLILIAIRRCRTRRDTVQFYENKMVRPAAAVRDPTWEPLRLDSDPDSKDDDPLPEYGYSNYDVIEKADHRPISPLPSGAMSLKPRLPKIIMTPATPSQRDSSVLSSVQPLSLVSEWEPERAGPSTSVPVPPLPPQIHTASPELQHLQVEINELRREMDESENIGDPAKRQQMMMEIVNKLTLLERLVQGRR